MDGLIPAAAAGELERSLIDDVIEKLGADARLTPAERRVVASVVRGLSNKEAARAFGVSLATVRAQLASVFRKLDVASRGELAHVVFSLVERAHARIESAYVEALRHLEAERNLFGSVLRQCPVGIVVAEAPTGRVIATNDELTVALGGMLPVISNRWDYVKMGAVDPDGCPLPPEQYPLFRALRGERVSEDVAYRRVTGEHVLMHVEAAPVRDERNAVVAAVRIASPTCDRASRSASVP